MTRAATLIVLQARHDSTRLPGKALATIAGQSILTRCLRRLRHGSAPVLLATTTAPEDDALEREARRLGVPVVRGPEEDVLARFVIAAHSVGASLVVRATADNPAVDMEAAQRVVTVLREQRADHVVERGLPYGTAVEAVTVDALEHAAADATDAADREHVTTFIRRDATRFRALEVPAPARLCRPDLRLTVDTPEDLAYLRQVFARIGPHIGEPSLSTIITAADALASLERSA